MEQAIKRAIEGGYKYMFCDTFFGQPYGKITPEALYYSNDENGLYEVLVYQDVLLDPLFWQCLGKAEGWSDTDTVSVWKYYWHEFIDHLAEGKDINSFFENLLTTDNTTKV